MWVLRSLEIVGRDIRQAVRTLRNDPGFTLVALAALTIGIASSTSVFSVIDRVILQPLPYPDPDTIVQLGRRFPIGVAYTVSIPKYMFWHNNDVFSSMALYQPLEIAAAIPTFHTATTTRKNLSKPSS
jgi:hypothetical protein